MNLSFWNRPNTDPSLNVQLASFLQCFNTSDPLASLINISSGQISRGDDLVHIPATSLNTQTIVVGFNGGILYLIGGLESYPQMNALYNAWAEGPDPADNMGCGRLFYRQARGILAGIPSFFNPANHRVFCVGHSFGGAVAQVLGAYLDQQGIPFSTRIWSYGSPRPGGPGLAARLTNMQNTRWFTSGDPVPHLPPHTDEVPATYLVTGINYWRGMNQQVQAPSGYEIQFTGNIVPGMGSPGTDSGFTLNVLNYLTNAITGTGSPRHNINTYRDWFMTAEAVAPPIPTTPVQRPEQPLVQRPREREATIAIGRAEIFADATSPTGSTRTYAPLPVTDPAAPRYHAARDARIWVVKLGQDIVAAATGKRDAKRIARLYNRSSRALLRR